LTRKAASRSSWLIGYSALDKLTRHRELYKDHLPPEAFASIEIKIVLVSAPKDDKATTSRILLQCISRFLALLAH